MKLLNVKKLDGRFYTTVLIKVQQYLVDKCKILDIRNIEKMISSVRLSLAI